MADVFTKAKCSEVMSRIRGKGNETTELLFIKIARQNGIIGWRRGYPLIGKPDFVFPKQRLAVFVDGDFWHGHPTRAKIPATNRVFWLKKIEGNKRRGRLVTRTLKSNGWHVVRLWEYDLRVNPKRCATKIQRFFEG
jgi:DNA mismatch endonuclease, patch repair protein